MDDFSGFLLILFGAIVLINVISDSTKPPPPPPIKPDPDPKTQEKIAISILKGKATVDSVAEKENYDKEHIKTWVKNYTDYAVKYSFDAQKEAAYTERLTYENVVLRDICREFIGDDWEEKTDFQNRMHKRYK